MIIQLRLFHKLNSARATKVMSNWLFMQVSIPNFVKWLFTVRPPAFVRRSFFLLGHNQVLKYSQNWNIGLFTRTLGQLFKKKTILLYSYSKYKKSAKSSTECPNFRILTVISFLRKLPVWALWKCSLSIILLGKAVSHSLHVKQCFSR